MSGEGTTSYTWDARDRLTSVAGPTTTSIYAYDPSNLRTSMGTQRVLLDGIEESREYGAAPMRYDHDPSRVDGLLAQKTSTGKAYAITDALGSIYGLTDSTGTQVSKYSYDVYGARTTTTESVPTSWGFTGRRHDSSAEMYYRARYRDGTTGTFASADSLGVLPGMDGRNSGAAFVAPYGYVFNTPAALRDPLGLFATGLHGEMTSSSLLVNAGQPAPVLLSFMHRADWIMDTAYQLFDAGHGMRASFDPLPLNAIGIIGLGTAKVGLPLCQPPALGQEDPAVAFARAQQWITDNLAKMEGSMCKRNLAEAATYFGKALHTVQDREAHAVRENGTKYPASTWEHCRLGIDTPEYPYLYQAIYEAHMKTERYVRAFLEEMRGRGFPLY